MVGIITSLVIIWHTLGFIVLGIGTTMSENGALANARGWEFVNPHYVYDNNEVNWFGAWVVALFYSALFPIGAICYWFYKLCTFRRK
jgi:hypothetical protein